MTLEDRFNLLKNACEEGLKQDPVVLEGKAIKFSEKSGKECQSGIFTEFMDIPENSVLICITPTTNNTNHIILSKNMRWKIAGEHIRKKIKEKCSTNNILISCYSLDENILVITVTF